MLEKLLEYERSAFLWLNGNHSPFWDNFMWLYTGKAVWIPLIFLLLVVLFYKTDWKESVLVLLSIVLIVALCDQFSSHICKPYFMRLRPSHHPDFAEYVRIVNDYRGGSYGFISGHSANSFGFATFSLLLFRYRLYTISILTWSTLMAYTRIYLGVHFITDIIPGALSGILFGWLVYKLYVAMRLKILKKKDVPCDIYTDSQKKIILSGLFATILCMLVYSFIQWMII